MFEFLKLNLIFCHLRRLLGRAGNAGEIISAGLEMPPYPPPHSQTNETTQQHTVCLLFFIFTGLAVQYNTTIGS